MLNEAEVTLPEFLRDFERGVRAARVRVVGVPRHPPDAGAVVGVGGHAAVRLDERSVLARLPVRLRVLQRHRDVRPSAPHQDARRRSSPSWTASTGSAGAGRSSSWTTISSATNASLKEELLPALIQWQKGKRGIPFYTEASINLADDEELMRLMVEAGFNQVFVGIETPEEAGLAECNKRQNQKRDLVADVKRIQRAGLEVQGGFIVGFDSDTPTIFQRQIEFIQKSGIVTAMVGLLQAMPGTKLYQRLKREGRLLGQTTGDNVDGTTNFIPRMNRETLREGYKSILRHIYAPGPYYQRIRTFLREYHPPKMSSSIELAEPEGVHPCQSSSGHFRSRTLPLLGPASLDLLPPPRALSRLAVTLSIYGHHFRKTCAALGL